MDSHPPHRTPPAVDPISLLEQAAVSIAVIGCATIVGIFGGAALEVVLGEGPELPLRLFMGVLVGGVASIGWLIVGPAWMDP